MESLQDKNLSFYRQEGEQGEHGPAFQPQDQEAPIRQLAQQDQESNNFLSLDENHREGQTRCHRAPQEMSIVSLLTFCMCS